MRNQLQSFAGEERTTTWMGSISQLREDWRVARSAHAELARLGMPRLGMPPSNVLVTGSGEVVENLLDMLLPDLREPIGRWRPGEQLLLPPPALIGTMIFQEIGGMPYDDQCRLFNWLTGAAGRTHVFSTTSAPLLKAVERGEFLEALYYRLNVIALDATV